MPKKPFVEVFRGWITEYEQKNGLFHLKNRELAARMGITDQTLGRWIRGLNIPERIGCLRIARFFDLEVDEVLQAAGYLSRYESIDELLAFLDANPEMPEREFIGVYLPVLRSEAWLNSKSHWKSDVDELLLDEFVDVREKCVRISKILYAWSIDPKREEELH